MIKNKKTQENIKHTKQRIRTISTMTLQTYNKQQYQKIEVREQRTKPNNKSKRKSKEHEQKQATRSMIANKEQEDIANNTKN